MTYIPIHLHTYWSLLDSTVNIDKLANKAKEYNIPAICLTDHHNIKGLVAFVNKLEKQNIQPIIGCELNVQYSDEIKDNFFCRVTVLCKNKTGYSNLLKILAISNKKENISPDGSPSISIIDLCNHKHGLLLLIGDIYSPISKALWGANYRQLLRENNNNINVDIKHVISYIQDLTSSFKDSLIFFYDKYPQWFTCGNIINGALKEIANQLGVPFIPSRNIHFLDKENEKIHNIVIDVKMNELGLPISEKNNQQDYFLFKDKNDSPFFLEESIEDGDKTHIILKYIEKFSIKEKPMLPKFRQDGHLIHDDNEFLLKICREGFKLKGIDKRLKQNPELKDVYLNRIKYELDLFKQINLSSYFLIVYDIIKYCNKYNHMADIRGSSTGCLINFLTGISSVDPLLPDPSLPFLEERTLPLSRFYNHGRNTEGNISMPDIDIDVPPSFRSEVIDYLKFQYGSECVAHIITHSRFKAKKAIKELFRLSGLPHYFELSDQITKQMVEESKISDQIAEIQEENPDYGIIQWNIDNVKFIAEQYENYKEIFDLAIELEKIPSNPSIHAAGIVVTNQPIYTLFPVDYSEKLDNYVLAIEGAEIEQIGAVKLDILGVRAFEKMESIIDMINNKATEPKLLELEMET